ncbi:MAG: endopeptidase La, partial [Leptospiraceae bacterium]|nr:endopeptidase La [Leptospiraceae bacterium]
IYQVGVVARVLKKLNLPDGGTNILINTLHRFVWDKIVSREPYLTGKVHYPKDEIDKGSKVDLKALMRTLLIHTKDLAQNNPLFTEEMKLTLVNMNEPGKMADFVCSILNLEKEEYQDVLETKSVHLRLEKVIIYLKKELELIDVQKKINEQINDKMDKQQRQFFLREQLKAIQGELGLGDEKVDKKYEGLIDRLTKAKANQEVVSEVKREIEKLSYSDSNTADYNVIRNYLDIIDSLPWEAPPIREIDLKKSKRILDRDHYKLEDVKDRILEFLAVKKLNPDNSNGTILCLVGPPGVGKTSIVRSVAEALGRKFFRISLGGMRDEAEIKGHRRTYIGSLPGKIITALRIVKEKDPVILLDEIDKLKVGFSGDPAGALLEVLDPEQNINFRDHYLDLPFDLSKVLFIATANTLDTIPRVLLDRMDVIRLSGYITEEKVEIFKKYLWTKLLSKNGLGKSGIELQKDTIEFLINSYSRESGLRGLERTTDKLVRKIAYEFVLNGKKPKKIGPPELEKYLGVPVFTDEKLLNTVKPGTALGLAWTSMGGATLFIEAIFLTGRGGLTLTGKLGKTMNESASIAFSYVKSILDQKLLEDNKRIHLHVPDGATPKDGPSAGITMASAILSLFIDTPLNTGYAMTGELTLTGKVLPIGGLKEKIVAAKRVGIKKIIFPGDNEPQLREIPEYIKRGIKFYSVGEFKEVVSLLFPASKIKDLLFFGESETLTLDVKSKSKKKLTKKSKKR